MGSEKLCLSWDDYESNFSVAFRDLRQEKEFFDVTLACKDGQLEAHKVILSSCSFFFKDILKRNPHVHPLLYMKDVKLSHLQAVMDFMYQGKVNVLQKELDTFLALSRELQVKGLNHEFAEENSVEEMEKESKDCLKLRKPEDLFKPKELGNNPKEEDERASGNLDMISKKRMSRWDSNANEEHGKDPNEKKEYQEDERSCELQHDMELHHQEAVAQRLYQRNMLISTAEGGLTGFGGQAVGRNVEENRDDVELGYSVGYHHVGNLCSDWNWSKCRFGIKCKWQHRCSKMMQDGFICKDQWHTERQHV